MNGLIAIGKCMISEICGKEHETVGMSFVTGEQLRIDDRILVRLGLPGANSVISCRLFLHLFDCERCTCGASHFRVVQQKSVVSLENIIIVDTIYLISGLQKCR